MQKLDIEQLTCIEPYYQKVTNEKFSIKTFEYEEGEFNATFDINLITHDHHITTISSQIVTQHLLCIYAQLLIENGVKDRQLMLTKCSLECNTPLFKTKDVKASATVIKGRCNGPIS